MPKVKLFCCTTKYYNVLDKLPAFITPVGLGDNTFPNNWETEKKGNNISYLNKHYAQLTMYYWIWKNKLNSFSLNDYLGFCEHRLLWLNDLYKKKSKKIFTNLYSNLLDEKNKIYQNSDIIIPQPVYFKNKSLIQDFDECHKKGLLNEVINFLPAEEREPFESHLKQNVLYLGNMFITKRKYFENYCEIIFPWVEKCFNFCRDKNYLNDYNIRLPVFLAERFSSYWMTKFKNSKSLSYAKLGEFHLSNKLNRFINTLKLPFTFYQYPTIYDY